MLVTEAIVLAGGLGTRLRSAVPDMPKCMAPVNGRPFLDYIIRYYRKQGIHRFIFSLGYKSEIIETWLDQQYAGLEKQVVIEHEPLGTGGAIQLAAAAAKDETNCILNGDTLFEADIAALSSFHHQNGALCTIGLKPMKAFDRYGAVETDDHGQVTRFREKQFYERGWINGGVYLLNTKAFLAAGMPEKFSFEKDFLETHCNKGVLYGLPQDGYFIDIGIPEDFARAQTEINF
ncbi:MAG: nucleotidyltransferase family protein [Bacteroidota bacterium]|nr:nucleotidyltransferase family protein [Bacteroidota bacterium]